MKIISKRNPVVFLNNIFANFESVPVDRYFIVDEITGELWTRNPALVKTGEVLPSLVESELVYENDSFRLKTVEEIQAEADELINESFYRFQYKVKVFDHQAALTYKLLDGSQPFNEYNNHIIDALVPTGQAKVVLKEVFINPPTYQVRVEGEVYLNFILVEKLSNMSSVKVLADDGITLVDLMAIEYNEKWDLFNTSQVIEELPIIIE